MWPFTRSRHLQLEPVGGASPLARVRRYRLDPAALDHSLERVFEAGRDGDELFVAWGGSVEDGVLSIDTPIVPRQRCLHTGAGMLVRIDGDGLFELNKSLHERGRLLAGQIHAHPTHAYHSPADDELSMVTFPGSISLVVPDFARAGRGGRRRWRWFRLLDSGWRRLDPGAVEIS